MAIPTCSKGHPITGQNLQWGWSRGRRFRRCRVCTNAYHVAYRKRQKRVAKKAARS